MNMILPVGISFFTFQALSYSIDVYKKKIPVEKNLLIFSTFISFFSSTRSWTNCPSKKINTPIKKINTNQIEKFLFRC